MSNRSGYKGVPTPGRTVECLATELGAGKDPPEDPDKPSTVCQGVRGDVRVDTTRGDLGIRAPASREPVVGFVPEITSIIPERPEVAVTILDNGALKSTVYVEQLGAAPFLGAPVVLHVHAGPGGVKS